MERRRESKESKKAYEDNSRRFIENEDYGYDLTTIPEVSEDITLKPNTNNDEEPDLKFPKSTVTEIDVIYVERRRESKESKKAYEDNSRRFFENEDYCTTETTSDEQHLDMGNIIDCLVKKIII